MTRLRPWLILAAALALPPALGLAAESPGLLKPPGLSAGPAPAQVEALRGLALATAPEGGLTPGERHRLSLIIGVNPGYKLNSDKPPLDYLTPTRLVFDPHPALKVVEVKFPPAKPVKLAFSDQPLPVFEKMVVVELTVAVADQAAPGPTKLSGKLIYQACGEEVCFPPQERPFSLELVLAGPGAGAAPPARPSFQTEPAAGESPAAAAAGSLAWLLLTNFLGGLALNLTPCVYPLLPITLAYFGGQARSRAGLLAHGAAYLLGLAGTYTALGTAAALSGALLGSALQHPLLLVAVAGLLLVLAGSMMGLYEFRLPAGLARLGDLGAGRRGLLGSLLMGLTLGLVAAPCLGPFILGVLTLVAQRGEPGFGAAVFGALSLGLGLPLALLGLFSSRIMAALPRSGPWLVWVRRLLGAVLVFMAVYLLRPLFGEAAWPWALGLTAAGGGLLAWLSGREVKLPVRLAVALAGLALGAALIVGLAQEKAAWPLYNPARLAQAQGRPVVLDFSAEWCQPCHELAQTLAHPRIKELAQGAAVFRVDLTDWRSREAEELRRRYDIRGVPTILFLGRDGAEIKELRAIGAVGLEDLVRRFRLLLAR